MAALFFLLSTSLMVACADDLSVPSESVSLSLNGTAFQDADRDGFFMPGETGLANVTIRLMLDAVEISNARTDELGQYFFGNLSIGKYELAADSVLGWNLTAPGAGHFEVTLTDKPGFGLDFGFFAPTNITAAPLPAREYPLMRPTLEEAGLWTGQYNASAQAYLSPEIAAKMAAAPAASVSLLNLLEYTPSERDQGSCGNCWAWAGTGVMEIDYARQTGVSDRFSVQYLNSNYNGGCGGSGACCGGWLEGLAGFYRAKGMIVPWSNANARYRDGWQGCGGCSAVSASSISTSPHYDLTAISPSTIPSRGIGKEAAISNIKNVLGQGKAIWFAFFLPDSSAWNSFYSFWGAQPESVVWQPDFAAGRSYNYQSGGGHAVLCVGYDDTDPNNRYWIMLNSWGDTTGRPAGLFRVNMDMNYDCAYGGLGYAFYWMTLDMSYSESENNPPQTPSLPQGPVQGSARNSLIYTATTVDPEGDPVRFTFNWGDSSTSQTGLVSSGRGTAAHIWSQAGTYQVAAKATDSKGDSSAWSDNLAVTIAASNQLPLRPTTPQGPAAGDIEQSYSYSASATDPDGDDVQLTFDWGDASNSVTEFVKSSEVIAASHTWSRSGTYYIRAKATDRSSGQSSWSSYSRITISGTANRPPGKPTSPGGVGSGVAGKSYSFTGYARDPNRDQIFYTFDWGDDSTTQSDLVNSGRSVRVSHTWSLAGTYLVRVMATDSKGGQSPWSSYRKVTISDTTNTPPGKPYPPAGVRSGFVGKSYSFSGYASDSNIDQIFYTFDWGDDSTTQTDLVNSRRSARVSHTWSLAGTYLVRVMATDSKGGQSPWSSYRKVTISDTTNIPPRKPYPPAGTRSGFVGKSYSFTGYASDSNKDQIFYTFDWGDGDTTQTDLVNSRRSARVSHTWGLAGTYLIRVMATDSNGAASLWSFSKRVIIKEPIQSMAPVAAKGTNAKSEKKSCPCQEKSNR